MTRALLFFLGLGASSVAAAPALVPHASQELPRARAAEATPAPAAPVPAIAPRPRSAAHPQAEDPRARELEARVQELERRLREHGMAQPVPAVPAPPAPLAPRAEQRSKPEGLGYVGQRRAAEEQKILRTEELRNQALAELRAALPARRVAEEVGRATAKALDELRLAIEGLELSELGELEGLLTQEFEELARAHALSAREVHERRQQAELERRAYGAARPRIAERRTPAAELHAKQIYEAAQAPRADPRTPTTGPQAELLDEVRALVGEMRADLEGLKVELRDLRRELRRGAPR